MKYLFVDTNNFIYCSLLLEPSHSPETIDKLSAVLSTNKTKLLLPEVVEIEFFREVENNYYLIEKGVKSLTKILSDNFPSILNKDKDDFIRSANEILKNRNDAKRIAKQKIKSLFEGKNVIRINLNSEIFISALKRAFAGKKPYKYLFCAECKELKNVIDSDCLIFESLLYKLRDLNAKAELIFCSNNTEHFAEFDNKKKIHVLNKTLSDDLPNGTSVKYFCFISKALNSEFSAKINKAEIKEILKISDSMSKLGLIPFSESVGRYIRELQNDASHASQILASNIGQIFTSDLNKSVSDYVSTIDQLKNSLLSSPILDSIKSIQNSGLFEARKLVIEDDQQNRVNNDTKTKK